MDRHLYRPELGRFARMINVRADGSIEVDPIVDASMWGLFAFGAYAADDPRVVATMAAVKDKLTVRTEVGGIARYEGDYYHAVSDDKTRVPGNPWFICTLWLALLRDRQRAKTQADLQEAREILEWVDAHKLPSGDPRRAGASVHQRAHLGVAAHLEPRHGRRGGAGLSRQV